MSNSAMKFDVREMFEGIRGMVSSAISGTSKTGLSTPSGMQVRIAVMSTLKGDAKNGKEIIQAIQLASGGSWVPKASAIYPLLEELTDEGLLAIKIEKERRTYSLTKAGKAALEEAMTKVQEKAAKPSQTGYNNNWLEMNATSLKAGAKLAQALTQVAQHGSEAQQKRAADLVDETRRKVYAILAED
ncbi:MAG: PadR family transcriptional regulator [Rhodoluna sp.]|nr:PadR family transcriptional regulator [Rhodoluna sp.]